MRLRVTLIASLALAATRAFAQQPITRAQAVAVALERGARLRVAQSDTAVANAAVITARARPNPSISGAYSKSTPNYHVNFDVPLDFPALRALRIRAAQTGLQAAQVKFQFDRAMIVMEADTSYTRAVAARERVTLSRRNALDADSLLHMVERRRDAGDASDLDVELARVNAGQQANVAASDSLTMISTFLDLQSVLGAGSGDQGGVELTPSDSLGAPPAAAAIAATSLNEVAATLAVDAAALNARMQRRSVWTQFSLALGFEYGSPDEPGILPTFGLGIAVPMFDRNRGPIAQAEAERQRAEAERTLARVEARNALEHARRERENALAKIARDQALVASATRVAAMALTGYREGALTLANVVEAQRGAREILAQYIDDLAAAWVATAELRVFSLVPELPPPTQSKP
jgi:cobalt-zinc-cadmium efflux system outer membrane protein